MLTAKESLDARFTTPSFYSEGAISSISRPLSLGTALLPQKAKAKNGITGDVTTVHINARNSLVVTRLKLRIPS